MFFSLFKFRSDEISSQIAVFSSRTRSQANNDHNGIIEKGRWKYHQRKKWSQTDSAETTTR